MSDENVKIAVVGPTAGFRNFVEYVHKNTAPDDRDEYVHAVSPIHLSGLKKDETGIILLENCHTIREWNNMFPIIRHMSLLNKVMIIRAKKLQNGEYDFSEYKL